MPAANQAKGEVLAQGGAPRGTPASNKKGTPVRQPRNDPSSISTPLTAQVERRKNPIALINKGEAGTEPLNLSGEAFVPPWQRHRGGSES